MWMVVGHWLFLLLQPPKGCISPSGRSRHWLPGTGGDRILLPAEGWSRGIRSGSKHATRRWHGRAVGTYPDAGEAEPAQRELLLKRTPGNDGAAGVDGPPPGGRGRACRNCDVCDVPLDRRFVPRRVVDGPFDPNVVRCDRDEMRPVAHRHQRGDCVRPGCGVDVRAGPAAVPLWSIHVEEESGLAVA